MIYTFIFYKSFSTYPKTYQLNLSIPTYTSSTQPPPPTNIPILWWPPTSTTISHDSFFFKKNLYKIFIFFIICAWMFSIIFLGTQPNIGKYFLKYFQEHNQTLQNISLPKKIHLKIFYGPKILSIKPNTVG